MAEKKNFLLRFDAKLFDELKKWADDELRSVNAQIEFLLRRAVDDRKKKPGASGESK